MKKIVMSLVILVGFGCSMFSMAADFNNDGIDDIAVYRPGSGLWAVRGLTRVYFGSSNDIPITGDYDGDATTDLGIFRGEAGLWAVKGVTRVYFGGPDDLPLANGAGGGSGSFIPGEIGIYYTQFNPQSDVYVKENEATLGQGGAVRVYTQLYIAGSYTQIWARIYRNNSQVGTEYTTTTIDELITFAEDISGWASGDLLQVYSRAVKSGSSESDWAEVYVTVKVGSGPHIGN